MFLSAFHHDVEFSENHLHRDRNMLNHLIDADACLSLNLKNRDMASILFCFESSHYIISDYTIITIDIY